MFNPADPTFWVMIAFVGFFALLIYYRVPGMIGKALDARAAAIRADLDEARRLRDEAQALLADYQRKSREAEEVMLSVMPFFHIYGMTAGLNTPVANAMTMVIIPNPRDMVHVLASIEKHRATYYPGVPTMFVGFNNFPDREKYDLSSVRFAISAAAPLPPEVQERFEFIIRNGAV